MLFLIWAHKKTYEFYRPSLQCGLLKQQYPYWFRKKKILLLYITSNATLSFSLVINEKESYMKIALKKWGIQIRDLYSWSQYNTFQRLSKQNPHQLVGILRGANSAYCCKFLLNWALFSLWNKHLWFSVIDFNVVRQ